jgi:predicted nucleic acid-binding protein
VLVASAAVVDDSPDPTVVLVVDSAPEVHAATTSTKARRRGRRRGIGDQVIGAQVLDLIDRTTNSRMFICADDDDAGIKTTSPIHPGFRARPPAG